MLITTTVYLCVAAFEHNLEPSSCPKCRSQAIVRTEGVRQHILISPKSEYEWTNSNLQVSITGLPYLYYPYLLQGQIKECENRLL